MSKTILITGTSTGLGISLAIQAAKAGHTVYATMRNLGKRDALDTAAKEAGVTLNVIQLDVQNTDSVNAAVAQILSKDGKVDVLINNAGAGYVRTTEQAPEDEINWVMDVNFMGVVRCTKAVLPSMRTARSGHVITIGSVGGLMGQPFNEIYCGAKFAVEGYMEALASYVTPSFGINFTTVEPGGIATEFANNVLAHVGATGGILEDEYRPILEQYIGNAQARAGSDGSYQTADQVAEVVMTAMNSDEPPIRVRTSKWAEDFTHVKTAADPDGKKAQAKVITEILGA